MTPNKKYEVLQAFDLGGTIQEVGAVIELPEADALQHVEAGLIKEAGDAPEGGTPEGGVPVEPNPNPSTDGGAQAQPNEPATPSEPEAGRGEVPNPSAEPAPVAAKADGDWGGNHTVGGNENAPLRVPHPDLAGAKA